MNVPPTTVSAWVHRLSDSIQRLRCLVKQGVRDIPTDFFVELKSPFAFFTSQQIFAYLDGTQGITPVGSFMIALWKIYNAHVPNSVLDPRNFDRWALHCDSLRLDSVLLYNVLFGSPVAFLSERANRDSLIDSPYLPAVVLSAAYSNPLQLARLILFERAIRRRPTIAVIQNAVAYAFSTQVAIGSDCICPRADTGISKGQLESALYFLLIAQHIEPDNVFEDEWSAMCLLQGQMLAGIGSGSRRCLVGTLQTVRKTVDEIAARFRAAQHRKTIDEIVARFGLAPNRNRISGPPPVRVVASALPPLIPNCQPPPQPASAPVPQLSAVAAAAKPLVDDAPIFDPPATKRHAAEGASEPEKKRLKLESK